VYRLGETGAAEGGGDDRVVTKAGTKEIAKFVPRLINDAPTGLGRCGPERSGGWRKRDFLGFREEWANRGLYGACPVGWWGQGKKVVPPPLRLRRSSCQPSFGQIKPLRGRVSAR
jgi:hypothetical protein